MSSDPNHKPTETEAGQTTEPFQWWILWVPIGGCVVVFTLAYGSPDSVAKMVSFFVFALLMGLFGWSKAEKPAGIPKSAIPNADEKEKQTNDAAIDQMEQSPAVKLAEAETTHAPALRQPEPRLGSSASASNEPDPGPDQSKTDWKGALIGILIVGVVVGVFVYYRTDSGPSWTREEKENAAHFFRSEQAVEAAFSRVRGVLDLRKPSAGMSDTDTEQVIAYLKVALGEAKSVRPEVLDKAHPDLRRVYNEKYIRSLEMAIAGHESRDGKPDAAILRNQWNDWWKANKKDVRFPGDLPR